MTTRLPINSSEINPQDRFETADGKILVLESFRIENASASLLGARIGDTIVTHQGHRLRITDISETLGGKFFARPEVPGQGNYTWFFEDGQANDNNRQRDAAELIPRPLVEIPGAKPGDVLVLRNGTRWTCIKTCPNGDSRIRARGFCRSVWGEKDLWFRLDGTCPAWEGEHDVVEFIPTLKSTIQERINEQIRLQGGKLRAIILSYPDYEDITKEYPEGGDGSYFNGVRVLRSSVVDKGCFRLEFGAL